MKYTRSIKDIFIIFYLSVASTFCLSATKSTETISLNGTWEMGYRRIYTQIVTVPGIHTDPQQVNPEKLWYRKEITLPEGNWKYATLELKGARFSPEVYVNGVFVSRQNGGMAPTFHFLNQRDVKPGKKIILEIALISLKDLPPTDASYIPTADQWRSNISSSIWNDVILKVHGEYRIDRIIPFIDFNNQKADISFAVSGPGTSNNPSLTGRIEIIDNSGKVLVSSEGKVTLPGNRITISYGNILKPWSPARPFLYKLKISLIEGNNTIDQSSISFGVKDFRIINKQFFLNNQHITLLGGTVVWHRWMRDKEGRMLGYDAKWFTENVILQLKEHGANFLRFHLGVPPEEFLDLCDKYGLAVQYEWSFFHGMPASRESLMEQYPKWLDAAMRHPSIVLFHPYNETEGDQLNVVWDALNSIIKDYPPLVMEDRDVIHVHKYWWSLFENLGLYYDNADQFPKAIMVDEFGGNYLDGDGMMGGYTTESETFLRFLGRDHTRDSRLNFQSIANSKVAEYWRRIGAGGAAPFCILGSWNDGNHWFMGKLSEGKPKPVWNELTAAWSPQSISLELWDRNFIPGQGISLPVYLFNDTEAKCNFDIRLSVTDSSGKYYTDRSINVKDIPPYTTKVEKYDITLPLKTGKYSLRAELLNRPDEIKYPVASKWDINIFKSEAPVALLDQEISVSADESEIIQFLKENHIRNVPLSDSSSKIILLSKTGWERIAKADQELVQKMDRAIKNGTSVVLLDVGERYLGQGYPQDKNDLGPLQGVVRKSNTPVKLYNLFGGIRLSFSEAAEPESHLHPDKSDSKLWNNIPPDHTWLWNGMRGGLIVPATNMEFQGLSQSAYLAQWKSRGADEIKILSNNYFGYELEGFYEFSDDPNDSAVKARLKKKLSFLIEDAPSLANSLNPLTPVVVTDISKGFRDSENGIGNSLIPLANAGKNLMRTPVIMITFGTGKGTLIVSQLLTSGRLAKGFGENGLYGIRYDEVANQFVLNMLELALKNENR